MADIAANPFLIEDAVLTLGTDSYEATASSIQLTPQSTQAVRWKGLKPGSEYVRQPKAPWSLDIDFAADATAVKAINLYAFDHEGEEVSFTYKPRSSGSGFSGTCILVPTSQGGAVDTVATATVSFPVKTKPTRI